MADADLEAALPAGSVPVDRVALATGTVVVTDLHLAPLGGPRVDAFGAWCDGLKDVPAVCCLGDLFDTWVGRRQATIPGSAQVLDALARLVARGVDVHLVPGNRDALIDEDFERRTGGSLHSEGFVASLEGGGTATFVHGDGLCTLDLDYLKLRRLWRIGAVRGLSRHVPLWVARRIAARLRGASETSKPLKLPEERSIRPAAVRAIAEATSASTVVCGHAHEARDEELRGADGAPTVRWIVVGAWEAERDLLTVTPGGGLTLGASATISAP